LPNNSPARRRERLEELKAESRTLVFYEAPHRLRQTLEDIASVFGSDRTIVLAREITKLHEEVWRGTVAGAIVHYSQREPAGEFTLVIAGAELSQPILSEEALIAELQDLLNQGFSRSQASRQLAQQTSLPRRQIYQLALSISDSDD